MVMPGTITNGGMQMDMERYRVARNNNGWYILDKWHKDFVGVTADYDIPDDHPALTILSDAAFTSLFKQAMIEGFDFDSYGQMAHNELLQANEKLREELALSHTANFVKRVEEEEPKENTSAKVAIHKIDLIEKLVRLNAPDSIEMAQIIARIGGNEDAID